MALLNFKYGLHKNLPAFSDATIGNVFVTTDEQAMHIDLPGGRVVISQIITLDTIQQWQAMKPPYSAQAFYYIVGANALLKYTGDGITHTWAQINSTADVENSISELQALVGTKDAEGKWTEGSIGDTVNKHTASIATIEGSIVDLKAKDETLTNGLGLLQQRVENLNTVAGFGGVYENTDAVLSPQPGKVYLIGNSIKICKQDDAGVKTFEEYPSIVGQIENLRDLIDTLSGTAADGTALTALAGRVTVLEEWKTATDAIIGAPSKPGENGQTISATGLYALIESAQNAANAAQQRADDAWTSAKQANDAIGVEAHYDENNNPVPATGLRGQINQNAAAITDIKGVIGEPAKDDNTPATGMHANIATNAKNIDNLATLVGKDAQSGLRKEIATNASDIDKLEQRAGSLEGIVGKPAGTDAEGQPTNATGLIASVNANTAAIAGEIARADAAEKANAQAISDLRAEVMEDIQTADAMVFKDVVASNEDLINKEATAEIGHTYKASAEFTLTNGTEVHIGDLLIATGEENEETGYITSVVWKHVPSGYIADYNPKIEAEEDIEDDNKIVLALSSGVAKDE